MSRYMPAPMTAPMTAPAPEAHLRKQQLVFSLFFTEVISFVAVLFVDAMLPQFMLFKWQLY